MEAEEDGRGEVGEGGGGTTEIRPAGREAEERVVVCCGVFVCGVGSCVSFRSGSERKLEGWIEGKREKERDSQRVEETNHQ